MRISPINLVSVRNQSKIKQNFNVNNNVSSNLSVDKFEKNVSFGDKFNPKDYWLDKKHHISDNDKIMKKIHFIEENITEESAEAIEKEFEKNGETVDDIYPKLNKDNVLWYTILGYGTPEIYGGPQNLPYRLSKYQEDFQEKFDLVDLFHKQQTAINDLSDFFDRSEYRGKSMLELMFAPPLIARTIDMSEDELASINFPSHAYYLKNAKYADTLKPKYKNIHTAFVNDYSHAEDIGDYIRKCDIKDLLDEYRPVKHAIPKEKYRIKPSRVLLPHLLLDEYTEKKVNDLKNGYIEDGYFVLQLAKEREVSQKKYDKMKQELIDAYDEGLRLRNCAPLSRLANTLEEECIINKFISSHCNLENCSYKWSEDELNILFRLIRPWTRREIMRYPTVSKLSEELHKMDLKANVLAPAVLDVKRYKQS